MVQGRGLNAVSFQDLADAVGLKKPSVFHHFPTKEALAQSLLERCRTTYGARYGEILARQDLSEPDRLREIARVFDEGLRTNHLCLLSALSNNCEDFSGELKGEMQETVSIVIERYAELFDAGRTAGTLDFQGSPHEAATAFLAMLQGLQVLARARNDLGSFLPAATAYIDSISN